jgi:hypothetical protein
MEFMLTRPPDEDVRLNPIYLDAFTTLSPKRQWQLMSQSGTESFLEETLVRGALQASYPISIAAGLATQYLSPEARRQFMISPEGIAGGSFIEFVRATHGF